MKTNMPGTSSSIAMTAPPSNQSLGDLLSKQMDQVQELEAVTEQLAARLGDLLPPTEAVNQVGKLKLPVAGSALVMKTLEIGGNLADVIDRLRDLTNRVQV